MTSRPRVAILEVYGAVKSDLEARQMSKTDDLSALWARVMNRIEARRVAWSKPATAFISQPEPRTIGSYARGRQLAAGNFVFAGTLIEAPDIQLWDLPAPDNAFRAAWFRLVG